MNIKEYEKVAIQYRGARQPIGNSRWIVFRTTTNGQDRSAISLGIQAEKVNWDMRTFNRIADYAFIQTPKLRINNSKLF